jgi:hypothetical protein
MAENFLLSTANVLAVGLSQPPYQENQGLFLQKQIGRAISIQAQS